MEDDPLWKKTSQLKTKNISATTGSILLKFEIYAYKIKPHVVETEMTTTFHGR